MATRGRRRTEWFGEAFSIAGSAGTLETTIFDTSDKAAPATILRVLGQLSITFSRSGGPYGATDTQGALIRVGIRTQHSALSAAAEDADLSTNAELSDERWMWMAQRRWVAETHLLPYWTGAAVATFYSVNTTGPSVVEIPIDIRAKRRWEDPMKLTCHLYWSAIGSGGLPSAADLRGYVRVLFAQP